MAPTSQILSRDTTPDSSGPSPLTPTIIAGLAFVGAIALGLCLWLGIYTHRKRVGKNHADSTTLGSEEKGISQPRIAAMGISNQISRDQLTGSVVLPHKNVLPLNATKDEIMQYHIASGTMTRPFLMTPGGGSTVARPLSPTATVRPISTVSFVSAAARSPSPRRTSFFSIGSGNANRPTSMASTFSNVSSMIGGENRKVRQLFAPVLPDELVLSLSERVMVIRSFDDGWCIVGRDSPVNPGDVEMGVVPSWCFVKPVKGLKASRPMRTSSLGVTVQIESGSGFSSRDEVVSWSNFS